MSTEDNFQADASSEAPAAEPGAPAPAEPAPPVTEAAAAEAATPAPEAAAPEPEAAEPEAAAPEAEAAAPEAEIDPNADPTTFAQMGLDTGVMQALEEMGYAAPMEVQSKTFRQIMDGRDLMVQSRTGSGKTAAFGIPFAKGLISGDEKGVQALCLCPTRELALQVAGEVGRLGAYKNLTVVPVYGGAPMGRQIEGLKSGAQIVAGTPGRVLDHLRRGTFDPRGLKVLVLDECDEMLSMGFQEEIEAIIERLPKDRQTLLFSATIPEDIERIGRRHMRDPLKLSLSEDYIGVLEIHHTYYLVSGMGRPADLLRVLQYEKPDGALIFCNTREDTSMVAAYLQRNGYDAEPISGDLGQSDRERVMGRMKAGNLRFLVATDVAARGIDIADLPCVINYTFPESPEVYIHRTGRTGRAGRHGLAISLVSPQELGNFYYLKLAYKIRPEERNLPSDLEMRTRREGERYELLRASCAGDPGEEWRSLARRVWQSADGERLVAEVMRRSLEGLSALAPTAEMAPVVAEVQREVAERPRSRSREDRPHDDRPRDRDRRRDRDRPRDRDRDRDRDRERRPERARRATEDEAVASEAPAGGPPPADLAAIVAAVQREVAERPRGPRPHDDRPREDRPRDDRPRDERPREERPPRDRERGERRKRGEDAPKRDREGSRRRGRDRGEQPAAAAPAERRPEPVGEPPVVPPGMEFWEAWVEQRTQSSPVPPLPPEEEPAAETGAEADAAPNGDAGGESRAPAPSEPGTVRLYLNLGRRDGVRTEDVAKLVAERITLAEAPRLQVRNTHTYVTVREEDADQVMNALNGGTYGERALLCERARGW